MMAVIVIMIFLIKVNVYEIEHIHQCINNGRLESPIMNKEKTIETIKLVEQLYQKWK